jgi:hypothetical protein
MSIIWRQSHNCCTGIGLNFWAFMAVLIKEDEPRYPLCPLLGDCFAYNASSLVHPCP